MTFPSNKTEMNGWNNIEVSGKLNRISLSYRKCTGDHGLHFLNALLGRTTEFRKDVLQRSRNDKCDFKI